ncbi:dihydrolipoyl dehydrogenase [Nocardia farcinica]|uniref:Dihydrolipoyl dehydrogenase n=1 Tax=Nocardia farcinica TaxID=37329 RepID=A0A449GZS0_NOCFR|nr:dihydrolipoyl dehydrogenase [Nocardia farcinica]VFA91235.1 Dihydrolipoyl dehydrogenase [Nocardia farcinica]
MTTTARDSDVLILGGGPAGYACAIRARQLGLTTTVIEAAELGGTCLHRGCIPTKALLHVAETVDAIRSAHILGIGAELGDIDMAAVHQHLDAIIDRMYSGLRGLLAAAQITVVAGRGRVVDPHTIQVGDDHYHGSVIVLAMGSRPARIPGIEYGPRVCDSTAALRLTQVPRRAAILGGGAIGVEFASIWASLGAEVTIVEAESRLLPSEDPWSARLLQRSFHTRGITVITDTKIKGVLTTPDAVQLDLSTGQSLHADVLLTAAGRVPRTEDCGLEKADVRTDPRGYVVTDENLQVRPGMYAIGDIVGGRQLAHRSFGHGIAVAERIAGNTPVHSPDLAIPRVTYSKPEVASVGLTEEAARRDHDTITTAVYDLSGNGRSQILGTTGGVKVIRTGTDEQPGPVLGIHLVGDRVGELIGEAQLIVGWEATPDDIAPLIHAHPTQNEALGEAMLMLAGKPLHSRR